MYMSFIIVSMIFKVKMTTFTQMHKEIDRKLVNESENSWYSRLYVPLCRCRTAPQQAG